MVAEFFFSNGGTDVVSVIKAFRCEVARFLEARRWLRKDSIVSRVTPRYLQVFLRGKMLP